MRPDPRRLLLCSLFVPILMAPPPLEALLLDIVKMREKRGSFADRDGCSDPRGSALTSFTWGCFAESLNRSCDLTYQRIRLPVR